ncbi:MAG TPA: flagellar motor switch protein FliN [Acidimicrobiales bacterium]|nr:flagellar motor switch protein FliN [Acidimicrobiales bacterium]
MSEAHDVLPEPEPGHEGGLTEAHPVDLDDLGPGAPLGPQRDLRLLADIPVELTVELGRSKLAMRDVLSLVPGSVVELDRPADASVDVLVNGRVIARGEVVVVDGECGVRITEIVGRA